MIPRVARSGHSFKGAALYYLHDKKADTKERVAWTHIHNIPTDNPDKAFKWMAYTAMSADFLKQQSGVAPTGRKKKSGPVYSYSLAWSPEQEPDKETMLDAAFKTLGYLELDEHEAVFVAHNDTAHPHVHVICNLIHPETGKKAVLSYDWITMSHWAEGVERADGEILCEQRVINNEKRRAERKYDKTFALVKHKEQKLSTAEQIQHLYEHSDNSQSFRSALEEQGYTMAQGDRRGFVLVDDKGKVYSLSRQLKGQRAKDIRDRLHDIGDLPQVKDIVQARQMPQQEDVFDRDAYETEQQKKIVDAAIEHEKHRRQNVDFVLDKGQEPESPPPIPKADDEHLRKLDAKRAREQKDDRKKARLKAEQDKHYDRQKLVDRINELDQKISQHKSKKKDTQQQEELDSLKQTLANMDQRIREQDDALEKTIAKDHGRIDNEIEPDEEALKRAKAEKIKEQLKARQRSNDRDKPPERDM